MRCLFCKADSSTSRSVEHGIPEALGNRTLVLPRGVICDRCNNYFAVKVEKPLLDAGWFFTLRARQGVPTKRGRLLPVSGRLEGTDIDLFAYRINAHQVAFGLAETNTRPVTWAELAGGPEVRFLHDESTTPIDHRLFSRFIAKIGLELIAQRIHHVPGWEAFAIDHPQFDLLRAYARFGHGPTWPVLSRRIYEEEATIQLPSGEEHQVLHESDILLTPSGEGYAVICLFGVEHAINLTALSTDGYCAWLAANLGRSPLYREGEPPRWRAADSTSG